MTDTDFIHFLSGHGLAAAGSTDTIEDLQRRHGARRWFNFFDVIDLPPASLFPEQTERFFIRTNPTCLLPPSEFECDFDYYRNGPQTHACALERLTALFGAPEIGTAVNTLSATWKFERMSLRILTFLREKTTSRSDLYVKHPELWTFCRISIDRNWVRTLTAAEAATLSSFDSNDILPVDSSFWPTPVQPFPWDRGLFRLAASGTPANPAAAPSLWKQAAAIGWRAGPWASIFDRRLCLSLALRRVEQDRSQGYSRLELRLNNPFSVKREPVDSVVLRGEDVDTLDRVAPEVSAFWELPLKIEESRAD